MKLHKTLSEATISNVTPDKKVQKAWLHDIFVLCDLMKPTRPADYQFTYNASGFSYYKTLKSKCKALADAIMKHDCSSCEEIDKILEYLTTIRFVGDISYGELSSLRDWSTKVYNHKTLKFSLEDEAQTLASFFADKNLLWTCKQDDYDKIDSIFFEYLKKYNCIKIV